MVERDRWVRAHGKRPLTVDGKAASSTDSSTWAPFAAVKASKAGNGFGFMLGRGIGCYDLDGVSDEQAREYIAGIPERIVYMERSLSGRGVHVFAAIPESRGSVHRFVGGGSAERYSFGRFIRMTGNRFVL